jgi:hypothetical protein
MDVREPDHACRESLGEGAFGLAARVSLWNREQKLKLFLETMRPDSRTTIVDVGVGDTGFSTEPGVAATHDFFEAMYPCPTHVRHRGRVRDHDLGGCHTHLITPDAASTRP